ncbi:MAG: hypothetical protein ABF311_04355 [Polaribacter sp.]
MSLTLSTRTITWDDVYGAWTSFHSYIPEWTERLGTNFYTFKNGELYIHDENEDRTRFYGDIYGCSITYSSNQNPSDIKLFKTLGLESNTSAWEAELTSELENGEINNKFVDKEGIRYGYVRRNLADNLNFNKLSILGIGELQAIPDTNQYEFTSKIPNQVSINGTDGIGGDKLYFIDGTNKEIGVIDSFDGTVITTASTVNTPSVNDFCFVVKDPQSESYGLRGYHAKIKLSNDSTDFVELFAANSEVFKSFM